MIIRRVLYTTDIGERNNWDVSKTHVINGFVWMSS